MSLVDQIQIEPTKNVSESDICDAVIKNISPELTPRSYLEGKPDMIMYHWALYYLSHFKEPNSTIIHCIK